MIAKIPSKRSDKKTSFALLINYVSRNGEVDPETGEITFNAELVYRQNIFEPDIAATEMWAVSQMNSGVKDPVMHIIISWREGEKPTTEQVAEAVQHVLKKLGYGEHQAITYMHHDTNNYHIHTVVNRIHPETYTSHYPDWAYKNLDKCMREIELKQGWQHDRGCYCINELGEVVRSDYQRDVVRVNDKARSFEARTGHEAFQNWIAGDPRREVEKLLKSDSVSWNDMHACLNKYNLELREARNPAGRITGYTIVDRSNPDLYHAKASQLSRQISKSNLDKKIGKPYEAPALVYRGCKNVNYSKSIERRNNPIFQQYIDGKAQYHTGIAHIKAEYNRNFRTEAKAINRCAYREIMQVERMMQPPKRGYYRVEEDRARLNILGSVLTLSPKSHRTQLTAIEGAFRIAEIKLRQQQEITALKADYNRDKAAIIVRYDSYRADYKSFLTKEADKGNDKVMAELARMYKTHPMVAHNHIKKTVEPARRDIRDLTVTTSKGGKENTYTWKDTGIAAFTESREMWKILDHSPEAIQAAIQMARDFRTNSVTINPNSSKAFQETVCREASRMNVKVTNPELQQIMEQYRAERQREFERRFGRDCIIRNNEKEGPER